jgi:hypothetical protein
LVDGLSGYVNEWLAAGRVDMAVINNARRAPYIRMDPLLDVDLLLFGRKAEIKTHHLPRWTQNVETLRAIHLPSAVAASPDRGQTLFRHG